MNRNHILNPMDGVCCRCGKSQAEIQKAWSECVTDEQIAKSIEITKLALDAAGTSRVTPIEK